MLCKILLAFVHHIALAFIYIHARHTYAQDSPQDYCLDVHNAARAEVGVDPLTWDNTVAAYVQNYVQERIADCKLVHSRGPYGENLAWSTDKDLSVLGALKLWVGEKDDYNLTTNACAPGSVCTHYTQVVWQDTHRLGCAKVRCNSGGSYISCNYDPPGNVAGQRPYALNQTHKAPAPTPAPTPAPSLSPFISPTPTPDISNFPSVPPNKLLKNRGKNIRLAAGLTAGACAVLIGLCFTWLILRWKRKQYESGHIFYRAHGDEFENGIRPRKFSYAELAGATNNFEEQGKLGEGGFGSVYRGFLSDLNIFVAVKKISRGSKQGSKEYKTEVKIISRLRHRNTVKLIGWCHEKELILVYEFMPNGSLDSHLFKGKSLLTWETRYKIIQDLASALLYLQEEGDHFVLHRDIKSSNVMLDSNFNAKLGDFGLARLVDHVKGSQTTILAGTIGYIAPECLTTSKASKESEVFSFGVVALEMACGRRSIDYTYPEAYVFLVAWVWESYGNKKLLDVVDKTLGLNFDMKQMESVMIIGLWCAHPDYKSRPTIRQVIQILNHDLPLPNLPHEMPIPNYDVHQALAVSSGQPSLSLTIPR